MKRLTLLLAVAAVLVWTAASFAAAVPTVDGEIQPEGDLNYGLLVSDKTINAQDGADVIVSGTIGKLPPNSRFWIEVGLVTKAVMDQFTADTLASLWDQGVYVITERSEAGVFSLGAEDYADQADTPAVSPVKNDGTIPFKLRLKPKLGAGKGGTATLPAANQGTNNFVYGKSDAGAAKADENYAPAYLVAQVHSEGNTTAVPVSATAKFFPYAIRVHHVSIYGSDMTELTKVKRGSFVNLVVSYLVVSTDPDRLYKFDGTVEFLGQTQAVSDSKTKGTYAVRKTFYVPLDTKPGKYTATVKLRLRDGQTTLYSDEYLKKITVE
jgi:hypothetical protein